MRTRDICVREHGVDVKYVQTALLYGGEFDRNSRVINAIQSRCEINFMMVRDGINFIDTCLLVDDRLGTVH